MDSTKDYEYHIKKALPGLKDVDFDKLFLILFFIFK